MITMITMMMRLVSVAAVGVLAGVVSAPAAEAPPVGSQDVRVESGLLSVSLNRAPAGAVFEAIGRQGQVAIRFDESLLAVPLTTQFAGLPLEQGLRRLITLLQTENFRMEFASGPDGGARVERLEVLAASGAHVVRELGSGSAAGAPSQVGSAPAGLPRGVRMHMEKEMNKGQRHAVEHGGSLPKRVTGHAPAGLLLKRERGEEMPASMGWQVERTLQREDQTEKLQRALQRDAEKGEPDGRDHTGR